MRVLYIEDADSCDVSGARKYHNLTPNKEYKVIERRFDAEGYEYVIEDDSGKPARYQSEVFDAVVYACPCCGYPALDEQGALEVCGWCGWIDDPAQSHSPDNETGANKLSMNKHRAAWTEEKKRGVYDDRSQHMAHAFSRYNRIALAEDNVCGCFYCCEIFSPSEINEWCLETPHGESVTALCPYCGIDSVIAESSGYTITKEFLKAMYDYWFGR